MAGIELDRNVIGLFFRRRQIEFLLRIEVRQRDHEDRTDELALVVVSEEWPCRKRCRIDVKRSKPGHEARQLHQLADLLVGRWRWCFFGSCCYRGSGC